jgi:hypothetical protein
MHGTVMCAGMDAEQVRRFALSFPGAEEYDHGGRPSFRVHNRPRFASGLDDEGISVALSEESIAEAVAGWPFACTEDWHGPRLVSVRVAYPHLPDDIVKELITDAWTRRASRRLLKAHQATARSQTSGIKAPGPRQTRA